MAVKPDSPKRTSCSDSPEAGGTVAACPPRRASVGTALHLVFALLGLCGVAAVLLGTHRYGVGVFGDIDHYLATARSLLSGGGYTSYPGTAYTQWPPLHPTLLAAIGLTGIDPQVSVRWVNALAFGLIVFLSGYLFLRGTASRALAVVGVLSVLASKPLLDLSVTGMSEPGFIVLGILRAVPAAFPAPAGLARSGPDFRPDLPGLPAGSAGVSLVLAGALLIGLGGPGLA